MTTPNVGELITGLLISIGLFLLLCEFFCWYWKLNRIVALFEIIEQNTKKVSTLDGAA